MDGRIENHIVDPKMPPLGHNAETAEPTERPSPSPSGNMWEVRRRQITCRARSRFPTNIFTSNSSNNR